MKLKRQVSYRPELVEQGVELSVRHLKQYFSFGHGRNAFKTKAVHDVSFDIKKGECFGLVGESGCGKTTTGRSLIKLYHITSGSIYFEGYRISAGRRWNDKEIKWSRIKGRNKIKEIRHEYELKLADEKDESKKKELIVERDNKIKEIHQRIKEIHKEQKEAIAQIKYDNKHVDKKLMSKMQMIFQDPVDSLDPRMTVEDIIQEGLRIQGEHNRYANSRKVADVLERVGLIPEYASRYPHEFSGGQRQRIGIARALVMNPRFLICDEPISALDVSIRAQIINLLNDLKEEMGLTIMFIAHDLSVVKYFCDRIGVMYFGQLVELATSDELFRHPLHPYTNALLSAIPKPDPISEKKRQRIVYKPDEVHDYSVEKPELVEIVPGHWVLANKPELAKYQEVIAKLDKEAKKHQPAESEAMKAKELAEKMEQARKAQEEEERKRQEAARLLKEEADQAAAKKAEEESRKAEEEKKAQEAKEAEEARKAEETRKAEEARIAKEEAEKAARLARDEAYRQKRIAEYRSAHRTEKDDVPAMFKEGFKKEEKPVVADEELVASLRRYRPEEPASEQKPSFLYQEPVKKDDDELPLFKKKPEPEEDYTDLPFFHKKARLIPFKKAIELPELESKKPILISFNSGRYFVRQQDESPVLGIFLIENDAVELAKALKAKYGVPARIRDREGKIRSL